MHAVVVRGTFIEVEDVGAEETDRQPSRPTLRSKTTSDLAKIGDEELVSAGQAEYVSDGVTWQRTGNLAKAKTSRRHRGLFLSEVAESAEEIENEATLPTAHDDFDRSINDPDPSAASWQTHGSDDTAVDAEMRMNKRSWSEPNKRRPYDGDEDDDAGGERDPIRGRDRAATLGQDAPIPLGSPSAMHAVVVRGTFIEVEDVGAEETDRRPSRPSLRSKTTSDLAKFSDDDLVSAGQAEYVNDGVTWQRTGNLAKAKTSRRHRGLFLSNDTELADEIENEATPPTAHDDSDRSINDTDPSAAGWQTHGSDDTAVDAEMRMDKRSWSEPNKQPSYEDDEDDDADGEPEPIRGTDRAATLGQEQERGQARRRQRKRNARGGKQKQMGQQAALALPPVPPSPPGLWPFPAAKPAAATAAPAAEAKKPGGRALGAGPQSGPLLMGAAWGYGAAFAQSAVAAAWQAATQPSALVPAPLTAPAAVAASPPAELEDGVRPSEQGKPTGPAASVAAQGRTTVMLRNIPNNYTRSMFTNMLDMEGFAQRYNFVYIPHDFKTGAGLGFAFVNLVTPEDAERLHVVFSGFKRWAIPSAKTCAVGWGGPNQQGLEANIERYRNSSVMHETVPDELKPMMFKDGVPAPFPPSTRKVWPPHENYGLRARRA